MYFTFVYEYEICLITDGYHWYLIKINLNVHFYFKKVHCVHPSIKAKMVQPGVLRQFLATITCKYFPFQNQNKSLIIRILFFFSQQGNILSQVYGSSCAWAGPNFLVLTSEDTPLKSGALSRSEGSLTVSFPCFGGIKSIIHFRYILCQ